MAPKKTKAKKIEDWEKQIEDHDHKKMVVKICVIGISAIIVLLWGFALRNQFVFADWNQSPEFELIKTAQEQWKMSEEETALSNRREELEHDAIYDEVKSKITEIIHTVASSTEKIIEIDDSATSTTSTENNEQTNLQINEN